MLPPSSYRGAELKSTIQLLYDDDAQTNLLPLTFYSPYLNTSM